MATILWKRCGNTSEQVPTKMIDALRRPMLWMVVILCGPAAMADDVLREVPQWGRFEASFKHAAPSVGTSLREPVPLTMNAVFRSPDGETTHWRGFYDGDQTWRVRFMPHQTGRWTYVVTFSDRGEPQRGEFRCVRGTWDGPPTALSANPIWFGRRGGKRLMIRSLHCGDRYFAANWSAEDRSRFLDWVQSRGYNTLSIASCFLNRSVAGRGKSWDTPKLWPIKPKEFQELEGLLDELDQRNLILFPFAGLFGRNSNFPTDPGEQARYIEYLTARLAPYRNLIWNVAGPEPLLRRKPFLTFAELERLAVQLRRADPFDHLVTVHNATGDDVFRGERWHDFGTLQGPKTIQRERLAEDLLRNHHPSRPLYAQETLWPGNTVGHPDYSLSDIRRNAIVTLFCATMINFGDMNGNSSSGFAESLDPDDATEQRHDAIESAWNAFDRLPWEAMKPRPDLVSQGYCLAESGRRYAVFLDGKPAARIRMAPGQYSVRWINVGDREKDILGEDVADTAELKRPSDSDLWIGYLTRKDDRIIEQNGVVAFEAESGIGEWPVVKTPTGKAIRDPGGGRHRYEIQFHTPGRYYVYLYAKQGPRGRDKENDVLLSLNGQRLVGSDDQTRPDGMRSYGDWKWTPLPKGPGFHTPRSIRDDGVYFRVPAKGTYTFEIAHRSENFEIDRVLMKREDPELPPNPK